MPRGVQTLTGITDLALTLRYYVALNDQLDVTLRYCVNVGAVIIFFFPSLLHSRSTRRRFYPHRSSRQAVVTGVVPSHPVRVFNFVAHRV